VKECTSAYVDEATLLFLAQLQTHDFGDRAGSCGQESERLGLAHLTSHFGTDTTAAAFIAWKLNGKKPVGSSIKALAHRIVMGFPKEFMAYQALANSEPKTYTSHVGDTNNFLRAVDKYLVPLAKEIAKQGGVIVGRPDSGVPEEQLLYLLNAAVEADMFNIVHKEKGYRGMTSLRSIQGDGMDFKNVIRINNILLENKFAPVHCGIYGIGGFLRNIIGRDNFGLTDKLCAVGNQHRPTMKFSHTPGKGSVPGLVKIVREPGKPTVRSIDEPGQDELVTVFDGTKGELYRNTEMFETVRQRVLNDFHKFPVPSPENTYSQKIKDLKKKLHYEFVE
jgi:nicotinic acid phosphoribosyltransferase